MLKSIEGYILIIGKGYRTQSGLPLRMRKKGSPMPNGLLLRGVVTATYVTDDLDHPLAKDPNNLPSAVYCDVLIYSGIAYNRWFTLSQVLVSQKRGGIHNDDLWKPKATKKNVEQTLNDTVGANPGSLDGDHVLVGFLNNTFDEPIILRGLPHPARDRLNELYDSGKRIKLRIVDGDPDFVKHHGVFRGVDDNGNYVVNSSYGNDGTTLENGKEPSPSLDGSSGNQDYILPKNSTFSVELRDMTNDVSPTEYAKLTVKADNGNLELKVDGFNSITVDGSGTDATLKLGNGAAKAAIADLLEALWGQMKTIFGTHTHTFSGPSGTTSVPSSQVPSWDSNINSDKLTFPFN